MQLLQACLSLPHFLNLLSYPFTLYPSLSYPSFHLLFLSLERCYFFHYFHRLAPMILQLLINLHDHSLPQRDFLCRFLACLDKLNPLALKVNFSFMQIVLLVF